MGCRSVGNKPESSTPSRSSPTPEHCAAAQKGARKKRPLPDSSVSLPRTRTSQVISFRSIPPLPLSLFCVRAHVCVCMCVQLPAKKLVFTQKMVYIFPTYRDENDSLQYREFRARFHLVDQTLCIVKAKMWSEA